MTGNRVCKLRLDNGSKYLSNAFQGFLEVKGIQHDTTTPYCPEQNAITKQNNHTIVEGTDSMLHAINKPLRFWTEAINTSVYICN